MAFSKSRVSRFQPDTSCAPPPTRYAPKSNIKMKGNTLFKKQKQVTTQIGSGPCPSQKEARRMSKLNSMPSLKSGRGNSEVQREVKLGGTTSFKHEPPRSSQPEMNKELPKEQGSVVEQQSSIGNQCDQALNSSGEDVDSVKGSDVTDLRRINGPIGTKEAVETKPDASDTFTESKHNGQEAELRTELPASQAQLGSAEHRMKEAQNKVKSLEKDIRAGQDEMLVIQASITDARNKNEQLRELLIQQQLVIEQTDSVICQECKLLKGQAKQVNKEISAQEDEGKKLFLNIDKKTTELAQIKKRLQELQEDKNIFEAQHALNKDLERALQER